MKNLKRISLIIIMAAATMLVFESCSPRYSNGRYRPRKGKKNCGCPAYGYNTTQTTNCYILAEK